MNIFLQGFTMGLAYVAPIGLQNLFVINAALTQKRRRAWLTALIVIFFDITLALACFYGVGAVMAYFPWLETIILFLGSLIVIYIGSSLLRAKGSLDKASDANIPLLKVITTACVVTWFNPQAIIDGTMMLGAFRSTLSKEDAVTFITGVTSASAVWFFGISTFITIFSHKFNDKVLRWINVVCGCVIIFYGLKLFYHFVQLVI